MFHKSNAEKRGINRQLYCFINSEYKNKDYNEKNM